MDLRSAIQENQSRVNDFIATAKSVAGSWTTPVREGKWSPAQVAEHVAIGYDEAADVMKGTAFRFPKFPFFLKPIAKMMAFDQVMKTGKFRPVKTFKDLNPVNVPASPDAAAERLKQAAANFENAVSTASAASINHPLFGKVGLAEYVQFQGYHTRHHQAQLKAN